MSKEQASILVTGGSGFLGGYISQELDALNLPFDIWDIKSPTFSTKGRYEKVRLPKIPKREPYDIVFHCAGLLGTSLLFERIYETEKVNVLGMLSILERQKRYGRILCPCLHPSWANPYMISKNTARQYGVMYKQRWGTQYYGLRVTHAYGPRQSIEQAKAVPSFIYNALLGQNVVIYGTGRYKVRLILCKDVAKIFVKIALANEIIDHDISIAPTHESNIISVLDLAKTIVDMSESRSKIVHMPMRSGQPKNTRIASKEELAIDINETARLFAKLDVIETRLEKGLCETIAWYMANLGY